MRRSDLQLIILIVFLSVSDLCGAANGNRRSVAFFTGKQDTLEKQILYNGRAWRNLYLRVKGNQFLFSDQMLKGSVTVSGKLFKNLNLKYDIYNDEILTLTGQGIILQLNKERVGAFTIDFDNKIRNFRNTDADSLKEINGYVNVLYDGPVSLYVKYRKSILLLAEENKYDIFQQFHRIYILKNNKIFQAGSKADIVNIFRDKKQEIRSFIKKNNVQISKKRPESFIPVVEFYNGLIK